MDGTCEKYKMVVCYVKKTWQPVAVDVRINSGPTLSAKKPLFIEIVRNYVIVILSINEDNLLQDISKVHRFQFTRFLYQFLCVESFIQSGCSAVPRNFTFLKCQPNNHEIYIYKCICDTWEVYEASFLYAQNLVQISSSEKVACYEGVFGFGIVSELLEREQTDYCSTNYVRVAALYLVDSSIQQGRLNNFTFTQTCDEIGDKNTLLRDLSCSHSHIVQCSRNQLDIISILSKRNHRKIINLSRRISGICTVYMYICSSDVTETIDSGPLPEGEQSLSHYPI